MVGEEVCFHVKYPILHYLKPDFYEIPDIVTAKGFRPFILISLMNVVLEYASILLPRNALR